MAICLRKTHQNLKIVLMSLSDEIADCQVKASSFVVECMRLQVAGYEIGETGHAIAVH